MSNSNLAVPELAAIQIDGITRQSFILRGALAAGAVYGVSTVGPFVKEAFAQDEGGGDIGILNFALTLEYLEAAYYKQGLDQVSDLDGDANELATLIQKDEDEHVKGLMAGITDAGGEPVAAPEVDFGDAFADQAAFLKLAQTLEDTGVSAYNGAGPAIQSKEILATAGSIVQVEARHAAAIRLQNDAAPTESAFDKPLDMQQVLDAVKPFVKS